METRIGICEDDPELRSLLTRALRAESFDVASVATGHEAVRQFADTPPDVLVLDIGLPDADGRDVCQALRAHGVRAPVIFLTARGALTDRLSGFHAGGDDYLVKPFAFKELVVRLRALMRRSPDAEHPSTDDGRLRLDPARHSVVVEESEISLTPTEYRLLATLASRRREVVRRAELVAAGWPDGAIVHDNTLDAYIARLRRKLRQIGREGAIGTTHGVGYRLE
ncbi:MAG TPA: response regulator transcription factor [Thermoleophilaceae bacterium]|nr:response regulator transcription factor [Thermoleophilaceae bacterium]